MEIKRYSVDYDNDENTVEEDPEGEFVRFEDVRELLQRVRCLSTEADMFLEDEGDAMRLADAITSVDRIVT